MKIQTLSLAIILVGFWLLNSGLFKPLIFTLGAISIVLVLFISSRMKVIDEESQPLHLTRSIPAYYLWLLKELVMSNIKVVSTIWQGNMQLQPALATIKMDHLSDMGKVIYANSISLTPGTVTTDVTENSITVHALDKSSISDIETGEMEARVRKLDN
ncbi:MAG: Na+/H+ antiporter subunit E [Gammaproteobacteria bacterium]|nr:Na+/H+ antiporter subunit E [Gammaproteobacteria bacterium]